MKRIYNYRRMRIVAVWIILLVCWSGDLTEISAQQVGLHTNALYWLTTTPNAGVDVRVGKHSTLGLTLGYNPFLFPSYTKEGTKHNPKLMHWFAVPEYKYWFCRPYERWFVNVYGIYGKYNVEGTPLLKKSDARYRGWTAGGGVGAGYQWALGKYWGIELSAGIGYMYLKYDKYECGACGELDKTVKRHWVGPNKVAVSFSYYIH